MENHAEHDDLRHRAEEAVGGRWNEGKECPHTAELFLSALSQEDVPARLRDHLEKCPVCMRTFTLAAEDTGDVDGPTPAEETRRQARRNLFTNLAALRVPVIRNCSAGRLRCLVGDAVLVLFLEPRDAASSWGKTCLVDSGESRVELRPAIVSSASLVAFPRGGQIGLRIEGGPEPDVVTFDWDGWGEGIRFLAVAFYRGSVEQAEAILLDLEQLSAERVDHVEEDSSEPVLIPGLRGDGAAADQVLDRLWRCVEDPLRRKLAYWEGIAPFDPRYLEEALNETASRAYQERKCIPTEPAEWLLKLAATVLLEILESRPDARCPQAKPEYEIAKLLAEGGGKKWIRKIVLQHVA